MAQWRSKLQHDNGNSWRVRRKSTNVVTPAPTVPSGVNVPSVDRSIKILSALVELCCQQSVTVGPKVRTASGSTEPSVGSKR